MTAPERTAAQHQSLLHFVGQGRWSDEAVLAKVRETVHRAATAPMPLLRTDENANGKSAELMTQ